MEQEGLFLFMRNRATLLPSHSMPGHQERGGRHEAPDPEPLRLPPGATRPRQNLEPDARLDMDLPVLRVRSMKKAEKEAIAALLWWDRYADGQSRLPDDTCRCRSCQSKRRLEKAIDALKMARKK